MYKRSLNRDEVNQLLEMDGDSDIGRTPRRPVCASKKARLTSNKHVQRPTGTPGPNRETAQLPDDHTSVLLRLENLADKLTESRQDEREDIKQRLDIITGQLEKHAQALRVIQERPVQQPGTSRTSRVRVPLELAVSMPCWVFNSCNQSETNHTSV